MQDKRGCAPCHVANVTATELAADVVGGLLLIPDSGESIHYIPELPKNLRRVLSWTSLPERRPGIARMAHHEAGHVVYLEWLGIFGTSATATPTSGLTHLPEIQNPQRPEPEDASGEITAQAAAAFHAGLMAEMLYARDKWTAPIRYPAHDDFCRADDLLSTKFGRHSSAAHAYSQCFALRILASRWERVRQIAGQLILSGTWDESGKLPINPVVVGRDDSKTGALSKVTSS